jgi:hypothetical protein
MIDLGLKLTPKKLPGPKLASLLILPLLEMNSFYSAIQSPEEMKYIESFY